MLQLKVRTIFQEWGKNENTQQIHKTTKNSKPQQWKNMSFLLNIILVWGTPICQIMLVISTYFIIQYVQARILAQFANSNPELLLTLWKARNILAVGGGWIWGRPYPFIQPLRVLWSKYHPIAPAGDLPWAPTVAIITALSCGLSLACESGSVLHLTLSQGWPHLDTFQLVQFLESESCAGLCRQSNSEVLSLGYTLESPRML